MKSHFNLNEMRIFASIFRKQLIESELKKKQQHSFTTNTRISQIFEYIYSVCKQCVCRLYSYSFRQTSVNMPLSVHITVIRTTYYRCYSMPYPSMYLVCAQVRYIPMLTISIDMRMYAIWQLHYFPQKKKTTSLQTITNLLQQLVLYTLTSTSIQFCLLHQIINQPSGCN